MPPVELSNLSVRREMELGLDPEEELEKLQNDVKQMAERILHYRQTLPSQLKEGFALLVSDQISDETEDEPGFRSGTSNGDNQGTSSSPNLSFLVLRWTFSRNGDFLLGTEVDELPM